VAISFSNPVGLENVLAKANFGSQTFGLRTVLAKANLKKGLLRRSAPRNDNEEDKGLEGVSNVMRLYIFLTFPASRVYNIYNSFRALLGKEAKLECRRL